MLLRLAQLLLWLALVTVGFLIAAALLYFARGSLEEFPTAEDTSKVRTVTGVGAALLLGLEVALMIGLRRVTRAIRGRSANSAVPPAA